LFADILKPENGTEAVKLKRQRHFEDLKYQGINSVSDPLAYCLLKVIPIFI